MPKDSQMRDESTAVSQVICDANEQLIKSKEEPEASPLVNFSQNGKQDVEGSDQNISGREMPADTSQGCMPATNVEAVTGQASQDEKNSSKQLHDTAKSRENTTLAEKSEFICEF